MPIAGRIEAAIRLFMFIALILLIFCINADAGDRHNAVMVSKRSSGGATNGVFKQGSAGTVVHFLKWYSTQYTALKRIRLVNKKGAGESRSEHYSVNFKGTDEYLSMLKGSGYISDDYIEKQRRYFREREEHFRSYPQTDGPAEGFEHDLVLRTQEIDEALAKIGHVKVTEVKKSSTSSIVDADTGMNLRFRLSKNSGNWLIDSIESNGIE